MILSPVLGSNTSIVFPALSNFPLMKFVHTSNRFEKSRDILDLYRSFVVIFEFERRERVACECTSMVCVG